MSVFALVAARHGDWPARGGWPALRKALDAIGPDLIILVTDDPFLAADAQDTPTRCVWLSRPDEPAALAGLVQAGLDDVPVTSDDVVVILDPGVAVRNRATYGVAAVWRLLAAQDGPAFDSCLTVRPTGAEGAEAPGRARAGGLAFVQKHGVWWDGTAWAVRAELAKAGDLLGRATAVLLVDPADCRGEGG